MRLCKFPSEKMIALEDLLISLREKHITLMGLMDKTSGKNRFLQDSKKLFKKSILSLLDNWQTLTLSSKKCS